MSGSVCNSGGGYTDKIIAEYDDDNYEEQCLKEREASAREYRIVFGLPEARKLYFDEYNESGIISTTNTQATCHESQIASSLISRGFFYRGCVFLDSYFRVKDGGYVQVDVIAVNSRGLFVFESKDYNGWIFGNGQQQSWTQSFYHSKNRFYNPVKQNYGHINCLRGFIGKRDLPVYSVIIFGENAELKNISNIPANTYICTSRRIVDVMNDIMGGSAERLSASDMIEVCKTIINHKIDPTEDVRKCHIDGIRDKTGESRVYY